MTNLVKMSNSTQIPLPEINNYDDVIRFARQTAQGFYLHSKFGGGRFQTRHPLIYIHVHADGTLRKIEIDKPGGTKFYLNP